MIQSNFSVEVIEKANKMHQKYLFVHEKFDSLPSSEVVIQNYKCHRGKKVGGNSGYEVDININENKSPKGTLWVLQNFLCFNSTDNTVKEIIPFDRIQNIYLSDSILSSEICIETEYGITYFGGFWHKHETLNLLRYLHTYPVTYIKCGMNEKCFRCKYIVDEEEENNNNSNKNNNNPNTNNNNNEEEGDDDDDDDDGLFSKNNNNEDDNDDYVDRWGSFNTSLVSEEDYEKPDLDISMKALTIADEIENIQQHTLETVNEQQMMLENIADEHKDINQNLHSAKRNMRKIESVKGHMTNAITSSKLKQKDFIDKDKYRNIINNNNSVVDYVDAPILMKHFKTLGVFVKNSKSTISGTDLETGYLRFAKNRFFVVRSHTPEDIQFYNSKNQPIPKPERVVAYDYEYKSVSAIYIRARHQHLDIHFVNPNQERFRCMSSFLQGITNELFLRCNKIKKDISVVFEPFTKTFCYGLENLKPQYKTERTSLNSSENVNIAFERPTSQLLASHVPKAIIADVDTQDNHVDLLQQQVKRIKARNHLLGDILEYQNDQIDVMNDQLYKERGEVHKQNYNAKRLN
eukprot:TRINITY_DN812_c1_g1_i1.p1 TRINITY_DN812_c1_g1~~TRINITY_DN812_c1_g1_i1.p1  ORF type:complete len:586 (+),score=150.04 TRINITY_DN812_c1_g1_i1:31-1758(+)